MCLQPVMWSPNSSTERPGLSTLFSRVEDLWQARHRRRPLRDTWWVESLNLLLVRQAQWQWRSTRKG